MLERTLKRNMLKWHVGREMFCPKCKAILDCRRAVEIDVCKQTRDDSGNAGEPVLVRTFIMCAKCYDARFAVDIAMMNADARKDSKLNIAVINDGRVLFGRSSKRGEK